MGKKAERVGEPEEMDDARRTKPSESTKQDSYELIKTDTVRTGTIQLCVMSSACIS